MITILPVQGESLARVRQTCPAVTDLLVMKDGEHWFHTPEQLTALKKWEETEC